ncbi:MAG: hypothetical protein AAFY97_05425 [Pseudomonadota bacterium]
MREQIIGIWIFSVAIVGFAGGIVYLSLEGQFLAVQRLGSVMVFVGTISAAELIVDRRRLSARRNANEFKRLKSQIADTRRWIFGLQRALQKLDRKEDMDLETALKAKQEVDATFERMERQMAEDEREQEDELETIDFHAGLNTVILLGVGTLIWGYGDLAAEWLAGVLGA